MTIHRYADRRRRIQHLMKINREVAAGDDEVPKLLDVTRPPDTWRVLCRYDSRFPSPDPNFVKTMSHFKIMVPLPLAGKRKFQDQVMSVLEREGYDCDPNEVVFVPQHRLDKPLATIHGRSGHISTPLEFVGVLAEHTFKGVGDRRTGFVSYGYSPLFSLREHRWWGFALAQTTQYAVKRSLQIHGEFEKARREEDPIVLDAIENGFTEANTFRYGCVVQPLQTLVEVEEPDKFIAECKEMLLPEEIESIKRRGAGIHPLHRGFEIVFNFSQESQENQIFINALRASIGEVKACATAGDTQPLDRGQVVDMLADPDNWLNQHLRLAHLIEARKVDGRLSLMRTDINTGEEREIDVPEAVELITRRDEMMLAEKDVPKKDMVMLGYTVPLQIRVNELPGRLPKKESEDFLRLQKTFRWYGLNLDLDEHGRPSFTNLEGKRVSPRDAVNNVMEKFTKGCSLAYHLVVNRRNGRFKNNAGNALFTFNYEVCSYFVDLDTVKLDDEKLDDNSRLETRQDFVHLIGAMHTRLACSVAEPSDLAHYSQEFLGAVGRGEEYIKSKRKQS